MKKHIVSLSLFILCSAVVAQSFSPMKNVASFKAKVQEASGSITTIKSDFEQEKHLAVLALPAHSSGKFYFDRSGKVRWDYQQPNNQVIILNGDKVSIVEDGELQKTNARTARAYRQMNQLMAEVIHGDAFGNDSFGYNFFSSETKAKVEMLPKATAIAAHIAKIELFFDDTHRVTQLVISEPSGDYTVYKFHNQQYNRQLGEDLFVPEKG